MDRSVVNCVHLSLLKEVRDGLEERPKGSKRKSSLEGVGVVDGMLFVTNFVTIDKYVPTILSQKRSDTSRTSHRLINQ